MLKKRSFFIFLIRAVAVLIMVILPLSGAAIAGFFVIKTYSVSKSISGSALTDKAAAAQRQNGSATEEVITQARQLMGKEKPRLKWGREDRVNILLLGKASSDYPGSQLTDTIILASFNPKTGASAMLSVPRDLYVKVPNQKMYTKINSVYYYGTKNGGSKEGIKYISETIEEVTGQKVDYFVAIDFKGFERLVDEIGGIRVNVPKDITDTRYPGPNFSYQTFQIKQGWQALDGATALKYVRTRHDADGDFGRASRQQQVLEAVKEKFFSLNGISFLAKLNAILDIISGNVETDIDFSEYGSFLALAREVNIHNTINKVLDDRGENPILAPYSPQRSLRRAYFLRPTANNYSEIHQIAENIFDLDKLKILYENKQTENPSILVIDYTDNYNSNASAGSAVKKRIEELGFKRVILKSASSEQTGTAGNSIVSVSDNTEGLKPYSLNLLLNNLEGTLESATETPEQKQAADFIIKINGNISELFEEDEIVLPEEAYESDDYQEYSQ